MIPYLITLISLSKTDLLTKRLIASYLLQTKNPTICYKYCFYCLFLMYITTVNAKTLNNL